MQSERFKELIDNAASSVALCHIVRNDEEAVDAVVDYANAAFFLHGVDRLGFSHEELKGLSLTMLTSDLDNNWFERCCQVAIGKTAQHWSWDNVSNHDWIEIFGTPLDEPDCFALTFFNVTKAHEQHQQDFSDLNLSAAIVNCARILQSGLSLDKALAQSFAEMAAVLHPDRIYVGKVAGPTVSLVASWCAPDIDDDISQFQNMDHFMFSWWEPYLDENDTMDLNVSQLEAAGESLGLRVLRSQGIQHITATVIRQEGQVISYLGVDNSRAERHLNVRELIESVAFFVGAKLRNERLLNELERLGRRDELTGLRNRNALDADLATLAHEQHPIGLVFCDVNGLKQANDFEGHAAGDELLKRCSRALVSAYPGTRVYRIGGDEFMVVAANFDHERFDHLLRTGENRLAGQTGVNLSKGSAWAPSGDGIAAARDEADRRMYEQKARYYQTHDRRRRN